MSTQIRQRWYWALLGVLITLGLPAGCQNDETVAPILDDGVRVQSVVVNGTVWDPKSTEPVAVAYGETVEIRAQIYDEDTVLEGAEVKFEELLGVSGTFSKVATLTDVTGWVDTEFQPTSNVSTGAELITVSISVGGDKVYVLLLVSAVSEDGINLSFSTSSGATSLPADGQSSLAVTVTVSRGPSALPVSNSEVVLTAGDQFLDLDGDGVFSGADQLVATGDLNGDGFWNTQGSIPETVTTDLNGKATFLYTSGSSEGTVYLKATAEGVGVDYSIFQHPTSLQITALADQRELLADGVSTTWVTTTVLDWSANPISGVIVRFVAGEIFTDVDGDGYYTPGVDSYEDGNNNGQWDSVGTIESVKTTDGTGRASALYTAGFDIGTVSVRATTSSGSSVALIDLVSVPPASTLDLAVDPMILPADGVTVATGTVSVRDVNGARITGKKVVLVAGERFQDNDQDGVFSAGDVVLDDADNNGEWTGVGTLPSETFTSVTGVGSFDYTSGLAPGSAWIRATADGVFAEAEVQLQDLPTAWSMTLSSSESQLAVEGAGGIDNTILTAKAFDSQGSTVPAGVPVTFQVTAGPGGGEALQGASGGVYETRTNDEGQATAVLSSGNVPGLIEVKATSGTTSRSLQISIGAGPASTISARTVEPQIPFWFQATVEAYAQDAFGNPVADGTSVQFSVDEGMIVGSAGEGLSRTVGGLAAATYYSLGPSAETDYVAEITVGVPNSSATTVIELPLVEPGSSNVEILRVASSIPEISVQGAGGEQEALIAATAYDGEGRAVGSGYEVTFEIIEGPDGGESIGGSGWGPVVATTDGSGTAVAVLRSGLVSGPVEIRATHGDALPTSVHVGMAAADVATVECFADSVLLNPGNTSQVYAYVYDENHGSVPDGTVVWWSADEGFVDGEDGGSSSLVLDGVAIGTYTATPQTEGGDGLAEVFAQASGAEGCTVFIEIARPRGEIASIFLVAYYPEIGVTGTGAIDQTKILAKGFDEYGDPVGAGIDVEFTLQQNPGGGAHFLSSGTTVSMRTDPQGEAEVTLMSGTISGTCVVQATSGTGASNTTAVAIAAGPPAYIHVGIGECNVLACGYVNVTNTVVAVVGDQYHNPVRDGTPVYFTVDKGTVHGDDTGGLGSDTTTDGVAGGVWRSGNSCEYVTVTASVEGGDISNSSAFIASAAPYSAEIISPTAETIQMRADGEQEQRFWIEVLDYNGMFVLPADLVIETNYGSITESETSGDGCVSSIASAIYKSPTLGEDYHITTPDDGIGAIDVVTFSTGYGGSADQVTIELLTGAAFSDESKLELAGSVTAGGSVNFTVSVADRWGNPLGGHTLEASVSGGSVSTLATTDSYGSSLGTYTAPVTAGSYSLTVVDTDPNFGGMILSVIITVQ